MWTLRPRVQRWARHGCWNNPVLVNARDNRVLCVFIMIIASAFRECARAPWHKFSRVQVSRAGSAETHRALPKKVHRAFRVACCALRLTQTPVQWNYTGNAWADSSDRS